MSHDKRNGQIRIICNTLFRRSVNDMDVWEEIPHNSNPNQRHDMCIEGKWWEEI